MSKCADCNELVGEEWSANNGLCSTCARDELSKPDTNQASEDADSLREKVLAILLEEYQQNCNYDALMRISALIRTEKLKLLDEVIHQSTVNLKSAKAVAGWAILRKEQLEAEL